MAKKSLTQKIATWSDEECLENFGKFLDRIGISVQFIQTDEGILTHQIMLMKCGDKVIVSEPQQLSWPVQLLPMPEAFEGRLN